MQLHIPRIARYVYRSYFGRVIMHIVLNIQLEYETTLARSFRRPKDGRAAAY